MNRQSPITAVPNTYAAVMGGCDLADDQKPQPVLLAGNVFITDHVMRYS